MMYAREGTGSKRSSTATRRLAGQAEAGRTAAVLTVASILAFAAWLPVWAQTDPLPSWNDGPTKQAIVKFVEAVTVQGGPQFVAAEARIAVFDNDGTLWSEQPMYFQGFFAFDRVKVLAPKHPEWKTKQPFKGILENDMNAVAATGEKGLGEVVAVTHSGMTTEEFDQIVKEWVGQAKHPRFQRPYTDLVFQPMLELLAYLRANGFKTFIVSGGGVEFMRVFTEEIYGIPPEQVVGSVGETKFEMRSGRPVLVKLPKIDLVDDKAGKPVGINRFIGRRPILAFGNSDGDQQMLEWTAAGDGARFMGIVHHTDAAREWAYDRKSSIGRLDKALDEALQKGWTVVDMKQEWKVIYPFQR
jgi:phosphoserine phosphatase